MIRRSIVVWFSILALAFANGALRELWIIPRLGPYAGHILSTLILCAAILLVSWRAVGWIRPPSSRATWTIGFTWLGLTLAFEFLVGHYAFGTPWSQLLADYNVTEGRIWPLVLVTTALAPPLAAFWRGGMRSPRATHVYRRSL